MIGAVVVLFSAHLVVNAADGIVIRSGPQRVSLLELYTSEGCSSCPPAEEWLSGLRKDPRLWQSLVPIAFHVDYWDRLGWKDRFARAEFTARQRDYALSGAASTVYTPGFFVNGREWFQDRQVGGGGGDPAGELEARLSSSGEVTLVFSPEKQLKDGTAHVAWLGFSLKSDVRRGENAGRVLLHDFVVLNHVTAKLAGDAKNHWTARFEPSKASDEPRALAVWVESEGRPVQAAGSWLGNR